MMIGNLVQSQFGASRNWPFGAALALLLVAVLLLTLLVWRMVQRRMERRLP